MADRFERISKKIGKKMYNHFEGGNSTSYYEPREREGKVCVNCGKPRRTGTKYCKNCRSPGSREGGNYSGGGDNFSRDGAESSKVERIYREQIKDLKEQQKADNARYHNENSNYDRLREVEAEIKSQTGRIRELEDEITSHEKKGEESALREAFLEHKEKEVEMYTKKFEELIKSLEKKRDLFYKSFFDECTNLSEEYKKVTDKFEDEDKKIEKEAEKIVQSSSKNILGKFFKSLSIFFWKIKERKKIRKEAHSKFIKSHNLDEMQILMLDKPLFYLMRTKSRIYNKFIEKYDLGEKEKYVFDLNKFNKIDSLPGKLFNILKEEFIDKNKEEFLNFSNIKKSNIDETIRPLKSEKNNIEGGIKRLNESREELKEGVCPQCHYRDKSRAKRICPDCAKKNEIYLRRMKKNNPVIHEVATTVGHTAYNLSHPKKYRHYD